MDFKKPFEDMTLEQTKNISESLINKGFQSIQKFDVIPSLETFSEEERLTLIIKYLEEKIKYLCEYFDDFIIKETLYVPDKDDNLDDKTYQKYMEENKYNIAACWLLYGNWSKEYKKYV